MFWADNQGSSAECDEMEVFLKKRAENRKIFRFALANPNGIGYNIACYFML